MTTAERVGHHGAPGNNALLTDEASDVITGIFKNRWRTLMSVDDVVAAVIAEVESLGLSDSTYFFCEIRGLRDLLFPLHPFRRACILSHANLAELFALRLQTRLIMAFSKI